LHNRHDWKIEEFSSSFPSLSLIVDWRERDMMDSSGLECKLVLFTLRGLKVKVSGFRVKFVEVCEWFDECDRLKIIFKS